MAHEVFISYSHKNCTTADAICHYFEEAGIRCWYAPRNIDPGKEWAAAISEALKQSRVMILIFTDDSNTSVQVLREVDLAVSSGVTVIPFKCTDTRPTGSMIYYLSSLHWLDAVDAPMEQSISKLLKVTEAVLHPKKRLGSKKYIAVGAGIVLAAAAMLLWSPRKAASPTVGIESVETVEPVKESDTEASDNSVGGTDGNAASTDPKYDYDETNDSPGAEDYLYSTSAYSDYYREAVRLDKFFGEAQPSMVLPELIDGLPVTDLHENLFEDCETLEEVVLPDTLETIRYRCFYGCTNLSQINMPSHLNCLEDWAFAHSAVTEMVLPETVEWIGESCFKGCEALKTVVLPEGIQEIGADVFRDCIALETIVIPESCTAIDVNAFEDAEQVIIIGKAGSYAETFAGAMNMKFQVQ